MSKIVNLNRVRKSKAREDKRIQADANAARFGRSNVEKNRDQVERQKRRDHIDGHRLEE